MESGTVRQVPLAPRIPAQRSGGFQRRGAPPGGALRQGPPEPAVRPTADQSTPDEPMAVLVVGCHDSGKLGVIRALLREGDVVDVPPDSYLVMRYGPPAEPLAYVPGCRQPLPYRPGIEAADGGEPAPTRPP
ncbi:MAG TPA: hypothetical protein VFT95_11445, partial [Micromonosporaceae bacterium]|nr:hypothetical protein [Micromonosporaceae bacterium]